MNLRIVDTVRRNHALEHGTVAILLSRFGPNVRLVGRAVPDGFYIYGRVPTDALERSAREALQRLKNGEAELAVTPNCGTNLAVAGMLTAFVTAATMGRQRRWERWPSLIIAAMASVLAAQPLGHLVQKHVTTSPELQDTTIVGIHTTARGLIHKVQTTRS